ncbi:hypothetical protein JTE90_003030 [Oedothorax gibbosus]|uniref:Uncharacterized protein n=1 Tax=Oedothorax gibbosus TaxID=931172 RepID=A0AAV6VDJ8_9ARAC|nr:hypothetical protein JTE90_003030 [Oedothorax gibbosus]
MNLSTALPLHLHDTTLLRKDITSTRKVELENVELVAREKDNTATDRPGQLRVVYKKETEGWWPERKTMRLLALDKE